MMNKIALEEHFFTQEHLAYLRSNKAYPRLETFADENGKPGERLLRMPGSSQVMSGALMARLTDLGAGRLAEMDKGGIEMQLLSLAGPGVEEFEVSDGTLLAKKINDELARAIEAHPDRFAGLATLAYADPIEEGARFIESVPIDEADQKYGPQNLPMPVAVVLGSEPITTFCAATPVPYGVSEVDIAGGLRGEPLERVKCETGDRRFLSVPHSEIDRLNA